ncbi:hypothetical protein R8Z50_29770 [Longispora sp. K20-0274]|uniref:hypothetical protein n=1 Tax=Longispora sp. K20-0274 TaxID=3088255 RepID=UPI00399A7745
MARALVRLFAMSAAFSVALTTAGAAPAVARGTTGPDGAAPAAALTTGPAVPTAWPAARTPASALAALGIAGPAPITVRPALGSANAPPVDRSLFDRQDLIYGSEIGAWETDGGRAIHDPIARENIRAARIRVIRWGQWSRFDDARQPLSEFNAVLDGIGELGAVPLIKLPPIWDGQCGAGPEDWSLDWLKEIVRAAGPRVSLYEFGNEPEHYCDWDSLDYLSWWLDVVPQLKRYARSLGFEIFVGGPALTNSDARSLAFLRWYLALAGATYRATRDLDYVPDFVSSHTYLTAAENATPETMRARIDAWGAWYDDLRATIDTALGGLRDRTGAPLKIPVADTEWNFTIDNADPRAEDPAYTDFYVRAMFAMLRAHHVWLSCQFTIASHGGGALDLLRADGTAKPLYTAYRAVSTADPENPPRS